MKKVVRNKEFAKKVGTIFLEQSVAFQPKLDRFFSEPKLEPKLLLDILGNNAYFGFEDRGLYEFLIIIVLIPVPIIPPTPAPFILPRFLLL